MDDMELLREYATRHSEEAFATLVMRHIDLVYSAALRHTRNHHQAQEISQAVFVVLARKAPSLSSRAALAGWLFQTARLTAANYVRGEIRRARREQEACMQSDPNDHAEESWRHVAPILNEIIGDLREKDRDAVVLRFLQGKDYRQVAAALGATEEAAQMRVSRALEKMRKMFARRGVVLSVAALGGAIAAQGTQAAPAGLAATVAAGAVHGTALGASILTLTEGTLKIMAWTKTKTIVTAALVATVSAGLFEAHQAAQLRTQNQTLQQQQASLTAQIQQLSQSLADATNQLTGLLAENARVKSNSNQNELLKLRGEVTRLRTANAQNDSNDPTDEAAKGFAATVKQMKQWLEQNPNDKIPELQYLTAQEWLRGASYSGSWKTDDDFDRALSQLRRDAKRTFAYSIGEALANYIAGNNGQLPGDISQLESYFNPPIDGTMLQRYQLLQTGNLSGIPNNEPLIAEKAPVDDQYDTLFKISATGFSYQGTGTSWVNGSGKGNFGTNITAKIKPFERQ